MSHHPGHHVQGAASQPTPPRPPRAEAPAPTVWVDPQALDSDWDPPAWHDRFRLRTKVLALLVAVALLAGLIWLADGFTPEATVKPVDWRTTVVTGPVEITLERALFEEGSEYSDPRITFEARCRLVTASASRVQASDVRDGLAVVFAGTTISGSPDVFVQFGATDSSATSRDELAPGVEPTPCSIRVDLPENQGPQATVRLLVFNQKYVDRGFAAAGEKQWVVVRGGALLTVPVSVMAED